LSFLLVSSESGEGSPGYAITSAYYMLLLSKKKKWWDGIFIWMSFNAILDVSFSQKKC